MISIALASYNGSKYIREQLDSILAQTYQDFELIISDDCSTDGTWQILEEYASKDNRIRIFENETNLGFKNNFEKAISLCNGEYIALSDQDDIWCQNHLELLLNKIGDKMIACGDALLVNADGISMGFTLSWQEAFDYVPDDDLQKAYSIMYFRSPLQGASMLIKKEFLEIALPIPEQMEYHDAWFTYLGCFYGGINFFREINPYQPFQKKGFYILKIRGIKMYSFYIHYIPKRIGRKISRGKNNIIIFHHFHFILTFFVKHNDIIAKKTKAKVLPGAE
jgi:glycosyltransferase involved in cell wall biosynthesis